MSTRAILLALALALVAFFSYFATTSSTRNPIERSLPRSIDKEQDAKEPVRTTQNGRTALSSGTSISTQDTTGPKNNAAPPSKEPAKFWSNQADVAELIVARADLEEKQKAGYPLASAAEKARAVINRFTADEFTARRKAGLYEVLQAHVPDVPMRVRPSISVLEAFTAEDGQWKRVQLPPDEYPDLYALLKILSEVEDQPEEKQ